MISPLLPYPKYKMSVFPWLGDLPDHWRVERIDRLFSLRNENSKETDERVTAYLDGRVTLRSNVKGQKIKGVIHDQGWNRVYPGDFVISGMNAHLGGMGVSDSFGRSSPIYLILKPKEGTNSYFVSKVVRFIAQSGALKTLVNTIRYNSADLKKGDLKKIWICNPPVEEQRAIVKYLDYVDKRVKKYIRAKQKQIKLLEEMKQALIHQAVTRGLDPTVPLKPSGVEWLGEIPHNWIVRRMKHSVKESKSGTWGDEPNGDDDIVCVRVADFDRDYLTIRKDKLTYRSIPENQREGRLLCFGDLLVEKSGGGDNQSVGTVVYYNRDLTAVCSNFIDKMTVNDNYDPLFLVYLHSTLYSLKIPVRSIKQTTGIQNLDTYSYFNEKVAFPPLRDQISISEFLQGTVEYFENKKKLERDCIRVSREYQARLIADVVTGKLDVREAASQLPEEIEQLLEEPDETLEEDLENGEEMEEAIPEEE